MDRCPLCRSQDFEVLYPSNFPGGRDAAACYECTSFAFGIHPDIFQCLSCSFVFNEPDQGALGHLDQYAGVEDTLYLDQEHTRRLTYARELEHIEKLCSGRDLLDVGCHTGFFLKQARDAGWRVEGVEPSKWAAENASGNLGLKVFNGPIERYTPEHRFDVITLWDVLEHLADPVGVLSAVRRMLRPSGLLLFTTHTLDSALARIMGSRYPFFMEMHTVHLNNRTRDLLLEKTGFTRIRRHDHRRAVRIEYLISRFGRLGERPVRVATRIARWLRLADRVVWIRFVGLETVIARPRGET